MLITGKPRKLRDSLPAVSMPFMNTKTHASISTNAWMSKRKCLSPQRSNDSLHAAGSKQHVGPMIQGLAHWTVTVHQEAPPIELRSLGRAPSLHNHHRAQKKELELINSKQTSLERHGCVRNLLAASSSTHSIDLLHTHVGARTCCDNSTFEVPVVKHHSILKCTNTHHHHLPSHPTPHAHIYHRLYRWVLNLISATRRTDTPTH